MEIRRRQFLTSPGESLLLPQQAMAIAERLSRWTSYTQLPKNVVISSPLLAIPLAQREAGKRWPETAEPAAFWHPLFWLPERLIAPAAGESHEVWAVRIALELTITGLYDVESGTWLDVLSTVGLDADDPVVQARITEWLEGESDPDLDRIDLSPGMDDPNEIDWSRQQAEDLLALLVPASWAVLSNGLISMAAETLDDPELDNETVANDAIAIIYLAQGSIGDGPSALDGEESAAGLWDRILRDMQNWPHRDLAQIVDGPFDALVESLYAIRNDYWVFVEALWENSIAELEEPAAVAA